MKVKLGGFVACRQEIAFNMNTGIVMSLQQMF